MIAVQSKTSQAERAAKRERHEAAIASLADRTKGFPECLRVGRCSDDGCVLEEAVWDAETVILDYQIQS